jgi:hypothetical protein
MGAAQPRRVAVHLSQVTSELTSRPVFLTCETQLSASSAALCARHVRGVTVVREEPPAWLR